MLKTEQHELTWEFFRQFYQQTVIIKLNNVYIYYNISIEPENFLQKFMTGLV